MVPVTRLCLLLFLLLLLFVEDDVHPEGMVNGPCHTASPHEYRCRKCEVTLAVKHLGLGAEIFIQLFLKIFYYQLGNDFSVTFLSPLGGFTST